MMKQQAEPQNIHKENLSFHNDEYQSNLQPIPPLQTSSNQKKKSMCVMHVTKPIVLKTKTVITIRSAVTQRYQNFLSLSKRKGSIIVTLYIITKNEQTALSVIFQQQQQQLQLKMKSLSKRLSLERPQKIFIESPLVKQFVVPLKPRSDTVRISRLQSPKIVILPGRATSCPHICKGTKEDLFFARFKELSKELKVVRKQNELLKQQHTKMKHKQLANIGIEEQQRRIAELRTEIARVKEENKAEQEKYLTIEKEYAELQENTGNEINRTIEALQEEVVAEEYKLLLAEEETARLEKDLADLQKKARLLESDNEKLEDTIEALSAVQDTSAHPRLMEARSKVEENSIKLVKFKEQQKNMQKTDEDLEVELNKWKEHVKRQTQRIAELKKKKKASIHKRDRSHEIYTVRAKENASLKAILAKANNVTKSETSKRQELLEECGRLVKVYQDELQKAREKMELMQKEQTECNEKIKSINKLMKSGLETKRYGWKLIQQGKRNVNYRRMQRRGGEEVNAQLFRSGCYKRRRCDAEVLHQHVEVYMIFFVYAVGYVSRGEDDTLFKPFSNYYIHMLQQSV
eukprot:TRINITY_DN657_c0_g1_i2.p1 TRINITY_DN657_c0_g1~~TRINITY_DN657_c0_g1_i2.p1  ORF type:complete len:575 (+),score=75.59 TRINITY_DN657_c0_g1_i2:1197-2921(+)